VPDEKRKGILSKIFGSKKPCCCNMRIEQADEDRPPQTGPQTSSRCCDEVKARNLAKK